MTCAPDQFACSDDTCVPTTKLCDGTADCPGGEDENRTNCYTTTVTPAISTSRNDSHVLEIHKIFFQHSPPLQIDNPLSAACRSYEFSCATGGQCVPQAWHCDGETDCFDGSDEQQCAALCGPGQVSCLSGDQCVDYQQLCDGTPHCRDASDESVDNCGKSKALALACISSDVFFCCCLKMFNWLLTSVPSVY